MTTTPESDLWKASKWVDELPPEVTSPGPHAEWADIAEALHANPGKIRYFKGPRLKGTGSYVAKKYDLRYTTRKSIGDDGQDTYELWVWSGEVAPKKGAKR